MPYDGPLSWLVDRPIAHRGLHDGNVAVMENSLSAARAAVAAGYGVECDVMLSADGVPMVFHDATLERMTGAGGRTSHRTAEDLSALSLGGGTDTIPTVAAFLEAVGGAVPVLMELKGTSPSEDGDFLARLLPVLGDYNGPLALMSFDPWLIAEAVRTAAHPVGLTAEGLRRDLLAAHRRVYEGGCAFVSYCVQHLPNPFTAWVRGERRHPVITWTVRTPRDVAASLDHGDQMTFEGFLPRL